MLKVGHQDAIELWAHGVTCMQGSLILHVIVPRGTPDVEVPPWPIGKKDPDFAIPTSNLGRPGQKVWVNHADSPAVSEQLSWGIGASRLAPNIIPLVAGRWQGIGNHLLGHG